MTVSIKPLFGGVVVSRSIRFNTNHSDQNHPSFGQFWRIVDDVSGDQEYATAITCNLGFTTKLTTVDGVLKGNITTTGRFFRNTTDNSVLVTIRDLLHPEEDHDWQYRS